MSIGRVFSREGAMVDTSRVAKKIFPGGGESGEIPFHPLDATKTPFLLRLLKG